MLKSQQSQQGMTAISMALILAICAFVLVIVIKLAPAYMENFQISASLRGLATDARVDGASDRDIKTLILKKLQIENISFIKSDNIKIERIAGNKRKVSINYETRINMMGNVDAVVVFDDNSVEIGS